MTTINNPHDGLFKGYMGDPENAKRFARNNLPGEILEILDLDNLHPEKDTFISGSLKQIYSDLLFSVNIRGEPGYIYLLFEHKSYPDKRVGFQLLKTMVMIWDRLLNPLKKTKGTQQGSEDTEANQEDSEDAETEDTKTDVVEPQWTETSEGETLDIETQEIETEGTSEIPQHLPIVIPILFYHGRKAWNLPASFQIMFNDYGNLSTTLQEMIPNFQYLCYDFSDPVRRKVKEDLLFEIFLMVQDFVYINDPEESRRMLREILKRIQKIRNIDRFNTHMEMFINYMMHAKDNLPAEEFLKTLESMEIERSGNMPTIAEQLKSIGREEGREEGILVGQIEFLWAQISGKFQDASDTHRARLEKLDANELKQLGKEVLDAKSLSELSFLQED